MQGLRALGFKGANFTIPHKVAVIQYLDGLSPAAELMGAVNCVNRVGDKLIGENTDGKGFVQSLREVGDPAGKRIVDPRRRRRGPGHRRRTGAEPASAQITIVNRSPDRGQELVDLLADAGQGRGRLRAAGRATTPVPAEADILINATSIGLGDAAARVPIAVDSLRPELIVADVIFNPPETWLIRTATERGCRTLDGLGMLVNQAVISFKIWTGQIARRQRHAQRAGRVFGTVGDGLCPPCQLNHGWAQRHRYNLVMRYGLRVSRRLADRAADGGRFGRLGSLPARAAATASSTYFFVTFLPSGLSSSAPR